MNGIQKRQKPIDVSTASLFEEAATVFLDPLAITFPDPDHSDEEDREITIGLTTKHRIVFCIALPPSRSHANHRCPEGESRKERKQYEEGT